MFHRVWHTLHRPRVWLTVEPVLLFYMFSNFLSYSSLQEFLEYLICSRTSNCSLSSLSSSSLNSCQVVDSEDVELQVQTETSHWLLYLNIAGGIPSILMSLLYGSLSDQLGRKLFIILPAVGSIFNAAVILQLIYLSETLPIAFLLLGSLVVGFFGNFSVINFAVYSYASDISVHSKRTRQIGILESMTYIGGTVSLLLGGVWIKTLQSYSPPFWCIIACNIVILVYVIVALPESQSLSQRNVDSINARVDYYRDEGVKMVCKSIGKNLFDYFALLLTSWRLVVLMTIFFIVEINFLGITDVVILYTIGEPLCWASDLIGYFLALKLFFNGISLLAILPILLAIGLSDTVILILGLISGSTALVIMGLSTDTWMMFLAPLFGMARGCVVPCIRSMLSKAMDKEKQGMLFSGISVVEATCTLVASVLYNSIYPVTRKVHPGLCFFIMAVGLSLPFLLTMILHITRSYSGNCCNGYKVPDTGKSNSVEGQPLLYN